MQKLNEKNSWNFDLIDHMGGLIKDDSRGVNFQKASCTLDASVKIYSNRVDDTYTSSHRILESLSRNGNSAAQEEEQEEQEEEEGQGGPRKAKVGSSKSSNRLNIAQTIERNPAALNAVKLENDYAVDPMFHKISKAFDEGGAKGMLMNNLVSPIVCQRAYGCGTFTPRFLHF
jgi:condensin complex subunit 2